MDRRWAMIACDSHYVLAVARAEKLHRRGAPWPEVWHARERAWAARRAMGPTPREVLRDLTELGLRLGERRAR